VSVLKGVFTQLAQNEALGGIITGNGVGRELVGRVVGGQTAMEALGVAAELARQGFLISLERASASLGPEVDSEDPRSAVERVRADLWECLAGLADSGLSTVGELTIYPGPFGALPSARWPSGHSPEEGVRALVDLVQAAQRSSIGVVLGTGPDDTVTSTLTLAAQLAGQGLPVAITVAASLRRSESDVQAAKGPVRIVKGGHDAGPLERFSQPIEVDKSFIRCTKQALRSPNRVCLATHDPRLIEIGQALALRARRTPGDLEFGMYLGRATGMQRALRDSGHAVRICIPFGPDWFARLVGGLAERPSGLVPALRSLLPGS
jgi:proline dehydrogenase